MEWDVMDSASQVVRRKDICAIGRGVRDGFESDRTFGLGGGVPLHRLHDRLRSW